MSEAKPQQNQQVNEKKPKEKKPKEKKPQGPITTLTFNPKEVAYSFGMFANKSGVRMSYFVDENLDDPVLKSETETVTGFIDIAKKLGNLSEEEIEFFKTIIPLCYKCVLLEELEPFVPEPAEELTNKMLLILGAPAVVDCEDFEKLPKLHALVTKFEKNALVKASKGQVAVAFKKYEQAQAKFGPTLPKAVMG